MEYSPIPITGWAVEDRPREKLLYKGVRALSDAELLAILIGSGTTKKSAVDLAREIMSSVDNNLNQLGSLSINEMQKSFSGIGQAKAITITAAIEFGRRREMARPQEKFKIASSSDVQQLMKPVLADLKNEEIWCIYLNRANKVESKQCVSQGGISSTVFDIRIVLKAALEQNCSGLILCHNHPSGNNKPSQADIQLTNKAKEASKLLDITLLDHVIIAQNQYYSFADEGIL